MPAGRAWMIGIATGLMNLGLYLMFTCNVGVREVAAGIITSGLATAAAIIFATASDTRFEFRLKDVAQARRVPWQVIKDTGKLMQALAMQLFTSGGAPGSLAAVPFDERDRQSTVDAGRRALVVTYNTATPNSIVLGPVDGQNLMVFHQLIPSPIPSMMKNLGANP
jgi:hypothetical protein